MKGGDLVNWSWHLGESVWTETHYIGVIIGSKLYKHAGYHEGFKCIVFDVLDNTGQVTRVREDEATLKLVSSP